MIRIINISVIFVLVASSFSQVTITEVNKNNYSIEPYDYENNYLGEDVYKYIGQELYLKGEAENLREYGYKGFILNYKVKNRSKKSNIYKCCDGYNSKYTEMEGKYFVVKDVHNPSDIYGNKYYLELIDKSTNEIVYYNYDSMFEQSFPFIVVGFYEKQKKKLIGKSYAFPITFLKSSKDIYSGKEVNNSHGQIWECIDLTVEDENYTLSLVLKNAFGEIITIWYEFMFGEYSGGVAVDLVDLDRYKAKYGETIWLKIYEQNIEIDFTEEMVLNSWGEPDKINKTSIGSQWVYDNYLLNFENGKLKSFN
jgi:hypothetical protein